MAKVRVYELAKEFGVESKAVMDQLKDMGEFVRSASSTIEAPVVRRLREAFAAQAAQQDQQSVQPKPAESAAARPADVRSPAGAVPRAGVGRSPGHCAPRDRSALPRWLSIFAVRNPRHSMNGGGTPLAGLQA